MELPSSIIMWENHRGGGGVSRMKSMKDTIGNFTVPSPPPPAGGLRTEALLQLASCTPLKARTPDMEWDRIVTP